MIKDTTIKMIYRRRAAKPEPRATKHHVLALLEAAAGLLLKRATRRQGKSERARQGAGRSLSFQLRVWREGGKAPRARMGLAPLDQTRSAKPFRGAQCPEPAEGLRLRRQEFLFQR